MSPVLRFVRRHRFASFVALTFTLTWIPWLVVVDLLHTGRPDWVTSLILLGGFGPFLAALVVAAVVGDLRPWLRNLVDVGGHATIWLAAVLLPLAIYGLAVGGYILLGGRYDASALVPAGAIPAIVVATFVRGGLEEPGWRGLALPVLQRRLGALGAAVVIGVVWAVWHLPLFVMPGSSQAGTPFWLFGLTVIGISVITTWLYNAAGGRVLLPIAFHTVSNTVSVATATGIVGDELVSQGVLLLVVWTISGVLVWRHGAARLSPAPLPDGGLTFPARTATRERRAGVEADGA